MNGQHVGEDADLYALGSLGQRERAAIDAHAARCAQCLRRLGEAEETILALECETPELALPNADAPHFQSNVDRRWWSALAVAAALVAGFLLPHPTPHDASPVLALVHSHFNHAQFSGRGPAAKVLYARNRAWYYIIVDGAHAYTVVGANGSSSSTPLGVTASHGDTSSLFISGARSFQRIELREGSTLVETAQIR